MNIKVKILKSILLIAFLAINIFVLVGCGSVYEIEISELKTLLSHANGYTNNDGSLDVFTKYDYEISFKMKSVEKTSQNLYLNTVISMNKISIVEGRMKESYSADYTDIITKDYATGEDTKKITVTNSVGSEINEVKIKLSVHTKEIGNSEIRINFSAENSRIIGTFRSGYYQGLEIKSIKLKSPTLEKIDSESFSWRHIEHADYYLFSLNNTPIKPKNINRFKKKFKLFYPDKNVVKKGDEIIVNTIIFIQLLKEEFDIQENKFTLRIIANSDLQALEKSEYSNPIYIGE